MLIRTLHWSCCYIEWAHRSSQKGFFTAGLRSLSFTLRNHYGRLSPRTWQSIQLNRRLNGCPLSCPLKYSSWAKLAVSFQRLVLARWVRSTLVPRLGSSQSEKFHRHFSGTVIWLQRQSFLSDKLVPECWERLKAGEEGDNRGWDGWMASLTRWTWVWASFGSWWWTGKSGMLQSMGSQRVRLDRETELNWVQINHTPLRLYKCLTFLFHCYFWSVPAIVFEPVTPIKEAPETAFGNVTFWPLARAFPSHCPTSAHSTLLPFSYILYLVRKTCIKQVTSGSKESHAWI